MLHTLPRATPVAVRTDDYAYQVETRLCTAKTALDHRSPDHLQSAGDALRRYALILEKRLPRTYPVKDVPPSLRGAGEALLALSWALRSQRTLHAESRPHAINATVQALVNACDAALVSAHFYFRTWAESEEGSRG